jgi:APA family basic amino acid/polyamine antiporter
MPVLPIVAAVASLYLMMNLPTDTWIRFAVWMAIGVAVYYAYGRGHSRLAKGGDHDHSVETGDGTTGQGHQR